MRQRLQKDPRTVYTCTETSNTVVSVWQHTTNTFRTRRTVEERVVVNDAGDVRVILHNAGEVSAELRTTFSH